jgi:GT2 family glycosyltransferase
VHTHQLAFEGIDVKVDVTISIVNWNTRDELRDCLNSAFSQSDSVNLEVFVVDNASSDGSAEMVSGEFADKVTLIANSDNRGFGAAHNQAIAHSAGRYILVLNPDSLIQDHGVLRRMVSYMDEHCDVGVLGPKILNPDGTLQFSARRFPSMIAGVFRHTAFGRLFPKNRFVRRYLMVDEPHDSTMDVGWVSGCAMMLRREMLDEIGPFDERFFMYCEDVDLCCRAHNIPRPDGSHWRVVYFPEVAIYHRIGAASDKNPIPMIKQHHRSMLLYFLKHNSRSPKILLTPLVLIALWVRTRARASKVRLG